MSEHHDKILNRLKSFTKEDIAEMKRGVEEDRQREKQERIDFFECDEFLSLYKLIRDHVEEHGPIDGTDMQYGQILFMSNDEHDRFISSITEMTEESIPEFDAFPEWIHHYRGITINFMSGQGVVSRISFNLKNDRTDKLKKIL